ncbi:MAG: hypothetical protein ACI4SV_06185 [Duodenibacillus sp.]
MIHFYAANWFLFLRPLTAWEKGLPISLIFSLAVVLAVVLFRAAETANVLGFVNAVAGRAGWSQTLSVVGPSFLAAGLGSLSLQLLAVQRTPAAAVVGLILLWWGHPPRVSCAIASRLLPPILLRVSSCCWLLRL